jgi:hypothetical protein
MSHTQNRWTGDTPFTDGQVFLGPGTDILVQSGTVTVGTTGPGLLTYNQASTVAAVYFADPGQMIRTGQLATPAISQEQFGTAALQPGPSAVANTSGPLGKQGFPPFTNAQNPVYGPLTGAMKKGFRVDYVDVIYSVATVNAALATIGITTTKFVDNVAPLVANILTLGANGLPVAFRANPYVFRITMVSPVFINLADTEVLINLNLTAGTGGTTSLYGIVLGMSFNWA